MSATMTSTFPLTFLHDFFLLNTYFPLEDRAYDFLKADGVERIIFAFKHYHPMLRPQVLGFLEAVY